MPALFRKRTLTIALAALGYAGFTPSLAAEEGKKPLALEEVIVTATKREETLNSVAVSVAAVSGVKAASLGQRTMADVVTQVPNVSFVPAASGNQLSVRGVGSPALDNVQSSVATFIDGVYIARSRNASAPLFDDQQVEILRGPQGALFGKNSIAGVFSITTAKPTHDVEGLVDLRTGSYNSHEGTFVLSGGLTDNVSARVSILNRRTGDYLENDFHDGDAGGTKVEAYRTSFAWSPDDNTDIGFKYEHFYNRMDNAYDQLIALDPRDVTALGPLAAITGTKLDKHTATGIGSVYGEDLGTSPGFYSKVGTTFLTLSGTHTFANDYELSATLADTHSDFRSKYANTDYPIVGVWIDSNIYSTAQMFDIRLASPVDDKLRFTIGAYADRTRDITNKGYSQANLENFGPLLNEGIIAGAGAAGPFLAPLLLTPAQLAPALQVFIPSVSNNPSTTTSYAIYGETTYEFTDQWAATLGLRGALDKRSQALAFNARKDLNGFAPGSAAAVVAIVPAGPLAGTLESIYGAAIPALLAAIQGVTPETPAYKDEEEDKALLPSGKLEFRPTVDSLVYLSAQSGFKNGGFNTASFGAPTTFNKEKSLAFELGGKMSVADGRGQINGALFDTKFKDLQVAVVDPVSGGVGFSNAAKATSWGAEVDAHWRLIETVTLGASYGYLNATYDSFKNAGCNIDQTLAHQLTPQAAAPCTQDLSGKALQRAPENSMALFVDYVQPLGDTYELSANVSANYHDGAYSDLSDSKELRSDSATIIDARISLANTVQRWNIALIGQNITNNGGQIDGGVSSGLTQSAGTYFGVIRQPAMYWLQLAKQF